MRLTINHSFVSFESEIFYAVDVTKSEWWRRKVRQKLKLMLYLSD